MLQDILELIIMKIRVVYPVSRYPAEGVQTDLENIFSDVWCQIIRSCLTKTENK